VNQAFVSPELIRFHRVTEMCCNFSIITDSLSKLLQSKTKSLVGKRGALAFDQSNLDNLIILKHHI